jgi:hypothetical protein
MVLYILTFKFLDSRREDKRLPARIKSDIFAICPGYPIINAFLFQCLNATNPWMNYLTMV